MTWPQFLAQWIINEWGTKRDVPPDGFAQLGMLVYRGMVDRDVARKVTKRLRQA